MKKGKGQEEEMRKEMKETEVKEQKKQISEVGREQEAQMSEGEEKGRRERTLLSAEASARAHELLQTGFEHFRVEWHRQFRWREFA